MSAKKSQSQKNFEKAMKDINQGIPVEKSKVKKPLRKKLMGLFASAALAIGFNGMVGDNDNENTQNQAEPTPVVQNVSNTDNRITPPIYDFSLNQGFNSYSTPAGYRDWDQMGNWNGYNNGWYAPHYGPHGY